VKKISTLLILLISCHLSAQEDKTKIKGTILSNTKRLANVHVINLTSKMGTISNQNGEFEMYARRNDTLYVSSIQYEKVKIAVTELMIQTKKITIVTLSKTHKLKEVIVKNHNLTQSLYHDMLHKPMDPNFTKGNNFNFNHLNFRKSNFNADQLNASRPPSIEHLVNPIAAGSTTVGIPNYQLIAEKKLRKKLQQQKEIPLEIIATLRDDFFIKNLKIPKSEIHLFLSYCEARNIINLYKKNNLLMVIKILQQEAPIYLALKKEE